MVRIREIVASGVLGEVRSVLADHTRDLPDDPAHRLNALELGGGALLDLGIYPFSFAFDILGEPREISAMARFKSTGADAEIAHHFPHTRRRHVGDAVDPATMAARTSPPFSAPKAASPSIRLVCADLVPRL